MLCYSIQCNEAICSTAAILRGGWGQNQVDIWNHKVNIKYLECFILFCFKLSLTAAVFDVWSNKTRELFLPSPTNRSDLPSLHWTGLDWPTRNVIEKPGLWPFISSASSLSASTAPLLYSLYCTGSTVYTEPTTNDITSLDLLCDINSHVTKKRKQTVKTLLLHLALRRSFVYILGLVKTNI